MWLLGEDREDGDNESLKSSLIRHGGLCNCDIKFEKVGWVGQIVPLFSCENILLVDLSFLTS